MSSFGETDLLLGNRIAGRIRVLGVHSGKAIYPRFVLSISVSLHEYQETKIPPSLALQGYELRELTGELRLGENTSAVGPIRWSGTKKPIRSFPYPLDNNVEMVCDLDWARVEAIEEHRAGGEAIFWLALWPQVSNKTEIVDSEVRVFRIHVPRDKWITFLEQLTGLRRSLVEVVLPSIQSSEFSLAVGHINEGRARIDRGDFDESISSCRRAIESMTKALSIPNDAGSLEAKIASITDAKRAKAYAGIVSRLKELGNLTVHRSNAGPLYMRAEAQFVVATTGQMLALLATLLQSSEPRE